MLLVAGLAFTDLVFLVFVFQNMIRQTVSNRLLGETMSNGFHVYCHVCTALSSSLLGGGRRWRRRRRKVRLPDSLRHQ